MALSKHSVPQTLLTFVSMMLEGPGSFGNAETLTTAALSIAQLIVFNAVKRQHRLTVSN